MPAAAANAARFAWRDRPTDCPMPLLERQRLMGAQAMISRIHLKKGCVVPTHSHANEQFCIMLSGRVRFGIGAEGTTERREMVLGPDEVLHLPSNVPHSAEALADAVILDIFSPPSEKTGIDEVRG